MAKIYKGATELIGNTPLVEVVNIEKQLGLEATILVKLEYFNPAGSVKDRIAKAMIEDAERQVKERVGSIEELTATEERRLADAQRATKSFFEKARRVCNDQLKALDVMSGEVGLPAEEEAAPEEAVTVDVEQVDIDEAVRSIEQGVSRAAKPEPAMDLDLSDFDLSPAPKKKNLSSTQSFNL